MILMTGGSGQLGKNLRLSAYKPTHAELDIRQFIEPNEFDMIVHCAAYTSVEKAETNKQTCFETNVTGTLNLLNAFPDTPFVYISSEYAHNPINFYSLTKSLAEQLVTYHTAPYLIIRTLFKPYPWPFKYAFTDQFTQGDYIDVIAPMIDKEIQEWDKKSKMIYVGTKRKTMFELASRSKLDVIGNSIKDMKVKLPSDYR